MKRLSFITILLALAASAGCTRDSLGSASCEGAFEEGDLVISEVQANPLGTDADQEYLEIYNTTDAEVNLGGLSIVAARADDTGEKTHRMSEITLPSGGYLALGNRDKDLLLPHLDYGYDSDLGGLRNSEAKISLYCAGVLVDEIAYGDTTNGFAVELDGDLTPSAAANGDSANLCNASADGNEYAMGNFGTPGEANGSCDNVIVSACDSVAAGDLVITEVMANPEGADAGNEYLEIYNSTGASIELENVVIRAKKNDDTAVKTHTIGVAAVGSTEYFAMGDANSAQPHLDYTFGTESPLSSIRNSDGVIEVLCGEVVVDRIEYAIATSGQALQIKPEVTPTAAANDDAENLCDTNADPANEFVSESGNFGTPGEPSAACDGSIVVTDCTGLAAGDLVLTEVLANPNSADGGNEFIEFYNTTGSAINLEGLTVKAMKNDETAVKTHTMAAAQIAAGDYFAMGDADTLPAHLDYVYGTGSSLSAIRNSDGVIELICDEVVIDRIEYSTTTSGRSYQLDSTITPTAAANDDSGNLCTTPSDAGNEYVDMSSNFGTPGEANVVCE